MEFVYVVGSLDTLFGFGYYFFLEFFRTSGLRASWLRGRRFWTIILEERFERLFSWEEWGGGVSFFVYYIEVIFLGFRR